MVIVSASDVVLKQFFSYLNDGTFYTFMLIHKSCVSTNENIGKVSRVKIRLLKDNCTTDPIVFESWQNAR